MNAVRIPVGGVTLAGTFLTPPGPGPHPAALFAHGWGSSQRQDVGTAKRLVAAGVAALTFNFRGHARTREQRDTVTRADNLADLAAAYDLLHGRPGIDAARIGIVGASYGGYLAVLLTAERDVRWLALRAPAIYKDQDFDRPKRELNLDPELPAYRKRRLAPGDNRALRIASRFTGDVLVVESEDDTVIPAAVPGNYVRAFGEASSVRHQRLAGADHGLSRPAWRVAYTSTLVAWLADTLDVAPAAVQDPSRRQADLPRRAAGAERQPAGPGRRVAGAARRPARATR
jgi:dipeptidyl aminopeptidase/acylaminoacyl peptidase